MHPKFKNSVKFKFVVCIYVVICLFIVCTSQDGAVLCCKDYNHVICAEYFQIDREGVISWVLSLQAHPQNEADLDSGVLSTYIQFVVLSINLSIFVWVILSSHVCYMTGQFFGFHGSRSSQFEANDNGVSKIMHLVSCLISRFLLLVNM